jgi:hypothetical protein
MSEQRLVAHRYPTKQKGKCASLLPISPIEGKSLDDEKIQRPTSRWNYFRLHQPALRKSGKTTNPRKRGTTDECTRSTLVAQPEPIVHSAAFRDCRFNVLRIGRLCRKADFLCRHHRPCVGGAMIGNQRGNLPKPSASLPPGLRRREVRGAGRRRWFMASFW